MNEWLDKSYALFERDEKGELLPKEVTLTSLSDKPKMLVRPIPRGALQRLFALVKGGETSTEQDHEIILQYCVKPTFTEEEVKAMKPVVAGAIVTAILALSCDIPQEKIIQEGKEKIVEEQEWMLKKKSMKETGESISSSTNEATIS